MKYLGRSYRFMGPALLILLMSAVLRFHALERQSLWVDELATWNTSSAATLAEVIDRLPGPWPPAHFFLLHFLESVSGDSEFVLRFPSALAGVLSVAAMYALGRRLYSHEEGLLGAVLMAVMWMPIHYSQEMRAYSMLVLFSTLSIYFWVLMLRKLDRGEKLPSHITAGYVITASLCAYTHYFGLLLVALQGAVAGLLFIRRRTLLTIILVYGLTALTYLPWVPGLWAQYRSPLSSPSWDYEVSGVGDIPVGFLWAAGYMFNKSRIVMACSGGILGIYALRQLVSSWRGKSLKNLRGFLLSSDVLLLLWWVIPFLTAYMISLVGGKALLSARYFVISLSAVYLLLARAVLRLFSRPRWRFLAASVGVALLLGHLVFGLGYYTSVRSAQIREAVNFVLQHDTEYVEDSLVTALVYYAAPKSSTGHPNYYFVRAHSSRRVDMPGGRIADIPAVEERIREENPRYIWFILTHLDPDDEFIDFLNSNYTLLEDQKFYKTEVWLFENKPPGS